MVPEKEFPVSDQPFYAHQEWPAWRYGPNGESAIFEEHDEIPKGWVDDPKKVKAKPVPAETEF